MSKEYQILQINPNGSKTKLECIKTDDILPVLTKVRSIAFDIANSGKHGSYPHDMENFNEAVETGFNCLGMTWTAEDGTRIEAIASTDERWRKN